MEPQEIAADVLKITPPVGVSMTSFWGIPLSEWVYIATIGYIIVQCSILIYKTIKQINKDKERP